MFDLELENELDDFVLETGTHGFVEVLKLLLSVLGLLGVLQVRYYVLPDVLLQLHILHGRIGQVNALLKLGILEVQVRNYQSHVSENVGIDDGTQCHCYHAEKDLHASFRSDVVASQQKHTVVDGDQVLMSRRRIVQVIIRIYRIQRSYPRFIRLHDQPPHTSNYVDVHDQKEDYLSQFHHQFDVLLHIHSLNNSTKTRDSDQL